MIVRSGLTPSQPDPAFCGAGYYIRYTACKNYVIKVYVVGGAVRIV